MKLHRIDPLYIFLITGAVLYALSNLFAAGDADERTIDVNAESLQQYLSAGGGGELSGLASADDKSLSFQDLNQQQRAALARRYIEEQALYREARAWGLDNSDVVIRRRMGQSLRFALTPDVKSDPGDNVLRNFYNKHPENYRSSAETSFDHIFFSAALRGKDGALKAANALAAQPPSDWRAAGDRFAYQRSYSRSSIAQVESHLGAEFVAQLTRMPAAQSGWQGPIASQYGYHLVRILARSPATTGAFSEVRAAVLDDWQRAMITQELQKAVDDIVAKYPVEMADGLRIEKSGT